MQLQNCRKGGGADLKLESLCMADRKWKLTPGDRAYNYEKRREVSYNGRGDSYRFAGSPIFFLLSSRAMSVINSYPGMSDLHPRDTPPFCPDLKNTTTV